MRNDWHGLMKVLSIRHLDVDGSILWESKNLYNVLHTEGEKFLLECLFSTGTLPSNYFFGLDNRTTVTTADTMASLVSEPSSFGYSRQIVASAGQFTVSLQGSSYRADSPLISFAADGGTWPAISKLFLTNLINDQGTLIATVSLDSTVTLHDGQQIVLQMGLSLRDTTVT